MIRGKLAFVRWDRHPANPGHALVIPYRHVPGYFDATVEEKREIWELVDEARLIIDRDDLIARLKAGQNIVIGKRSEFQGANFTTGARIEMTEKGGTSRVFTEGSQAEQDQLVGVPRI